MFALRSPKLIGLGAAVVLLALAAGNQGQVGWAQPTLPFTEPFTTIPPWATACTSPQGATVNPNPVFDPVFGKTVLQVFIGPSNLLFYCGPGFNLSSNFVAEMAARKSAGPVTPTLAVVYGIVFRATGSTFYWFAVSTAGYYGLFKFPAPGPRPFGTLSHPGVEIIPWTWDFNVATGNNPNTLKVAVQDGRVTLFVNGAQVQQALLLSDGPVSGDVALAIGTFELIPWAAVTVHFSSMAVRTCSPQTAPQSC